MNVVRTIRERLVRFALSIRSVTGDAIDRDALHKFLTFSLLEVTRHDIVGRGASDNIVNFGDIHFIFPPQLISRSGGLWSDEILIRDFIADVLGSKVSKVARRSDIRINISRAKIISHSAANYYALLKPRANLMEHSAFITA